MINILFGLLLIGYYHSSAQTQNAGTRFGWLKGEWQMVTPKGTLIEIWRDTANGALTGEVCFINHNGEKRVLENVLLTCNDTACWYIPSVTNQNESYPVKFRLTIIAGQAFTAENPDHDFPKRIVYELVSSDAIHAWIDNGKTVPGKRKDYYYTKKK